MNKTITFNIKTSTNIKFGEAAVILSALTQIFAKSYNASSLRLYEHLIGDSKLKKGNESKIIQAWSTDLAYHPSYKELKSSYLALGLVQKLRANYAGGKAWDIRTGKALPPFTHSDMLVLYRQAGLKLRFEKVFEDRQELLIDIPVPKWTIVKNAKGYNEVEFRDGQSKITLWLSSKNRDIDLKDIIDKKITTCEIKKTSRKNNQGHTKWKIMLSYKDDVVERSLDPKKQAVITFDFSHPIICTIPGKELKIKNNEVASVTAGQLARIRKMSIQSGQSRTGHGKTQKFKNITNLGNRYRERRKKITEGHVALVDRFLIANNIGTVEIKAPDQDKKKKSLLYRLHWNVAEYLLKLENRLKQTGIKIIK